MARAPRIQRRLRGTRRQKFRQFRWLEWLEPRTLLTATPDGGALDWQAMLSGHGSVCQCPVCTGIGLDEIPEEVGAPGDGALAESLASLPLLSSRPSAAAKLFLDFDGHFQASWGSWTNVNTPAFDRDGNPTTFSASELSAIHEIWRRVAEDFAPFNIDVTTIAPGSQANRVVAHIAIGGSASDWYGSSAGGVAYVGGFYNSAPNVGYVFENNLGNGNPKYVAEAASHEAGHLFGLQHQAKWSGTTLVESYNSGGNGWAPIMGLGYYQERTTWHNGPTSFGSSSFQDDLAILAGANNAFGYAPDDFGNTRGTAAPLVVLSGGNIQVNGLIGRHDDVDVFSFTTAGGTASFQLAVNSVGPNLDSVLELWDAAGTIASAAPTNSLGASLSASLGAGTYYVVARSLGDYGNMGQYTLTGTLPTSQTAPEITVLSGTTALASGQSVDFGSTPQGAPVSRTITVRNDGSATLNLQPLDPQSLPAGFQLVSNLGTSALAPGGTTSFTIRLAGSTPGTFGGLLRIFSNDADENPFELALAGSVFAPDTSPPTAQFAAVAPNPRNSSVGRLDLLFNEPVSGVDLADLRLTRNDQQINLAGNSLSGSGTSYTVDLANFTAAEGVYVLTLVASGSGIVDGAGNPLAVNASASWTTDTTRPAAQFAAVVPNPRSTAVGSVALTFTEAVTGLNPADLRLTRNGQQINLPGNLLSGSGANYALNLANLSAAEGDYVLTLLADNSGIADSAGNLLDANASVAWRTDTTAPTAQFSQVAPNPRHQAVGALGLTFSEPIGGLDLADFQLTRDGEPIALAGGLLTGSGANYSLDLSGFTASEGDYVLRLPSGGTGIADSAGNPLARDAAVSWSTDTTAPTVLFNAVAPNPRNTAVGLLGLTFSEPIVGLDVADLRLTRNGVDVTLAGNLLAGSGADYTLDLAALTGSEGEYVLTLGAGNAGIADSAGNPLAGGAVVSWSTDTTAPTVLFNAVAPNPRKTAVGLLGLTFSEPIVGLDLADLQLTRNGQPIDLSGNLLAGSGTNYTLNLADFTAIEGEYVLRLIVSGSGIADSAGNLLASPAEVSWTTDTTSPSAQFAAVVPNPRNTPVASLELTFSEPVSGLNLADFVLTRGGVPVSLAGDRLAGSGVYYTLVLADVTAADGDYVLTLAASGSGIADAVGNLLAEDANVAWTTETSSPTAQFGAVASPRNTAVDAVALDFTKPVSGLDLTDLQLTRNGDVVELVGNILSGSGASYTLDLANFTAAEGNYALTLAASGSEIRDAAGNLLAAEAGVQWSTDVTGPTVQFAAVAPNPRNTKVDQLEIFFSEPVTGFDLADLRLTRSGVAVELAGNLLAGSGANYSLALADVTAAAGDYVLTLAAAGAGIADGAGNAFAIDAVAAWTVETAAPAAEWAAVAPHPRNTPVGPLALTFNKPVSGVDLSDFLLTRDGQAVQLAGTLLVGSGASYTLDLASVTNLAGNYVLTLSAGGSGIVDSFGNLLAADASATWTTDTTAPTAQFAPLSPNPRNSAVGSVQLTFSEAVTGLDLADLELTRNGQLVQLAGNLLSGSVDSYAIDLAEYTALEGQYALKLAAGSAGIYDSAGNVLATDAEVAWTVDTTRPLAQFAAVSPNPRNTAVGALGLSFSEPIAGLDLADFRLTRDGTPIELAGNLLAGSGAAYALDLTDFTAAEGNYVLTLAAAGSGIADAVGNPLAGDATAVWTVETSAPLAKFGEVAPSLRNTAVPSLGLTFNKPITGLDLTDFVLLRSGQPVTLSGDLLAGSGASYTLNLADFTAAPGDYSLTLAAGGSGIVDSLGNPLASDATALWSTDTSPPTAQFAAVSPNPRSTAVGSISLAFSETVTGLDLADLRLSRDGQTIELSGNRLAGSGSQYTLDLSGLTAGGGGYALTLVAQGSGISDGAGNPLAASADVAWLTDTTAPSAQFEAISPNPRNTAVGALRLEFDEPVTGLDLADLQLTRDGQSVALAGNLLSGSGASYVLDLSGYSAVQGAYALTLAAGGAGIVDAVGNPFAADATVLWSTDTTSPLASFGAVVPNPRSTPVAEISLSFSEAVTGFDASGLQLWRGGERIFLTSDMLRGGGADYTLQLDNVTAWEGDYVLILAAAGAGISDAVGNPLAEDASVAWTIETSRPTAQFAPVASPRNTAVAAVALGFSKTVSGLDLADLRLTRDGELVELAGNILSGSGAAYTLDLSGFTALPGAYSLTLVAGGSEIADGAGNWLADDAGVAWTTETTPPTAQFAAVDPNPRNSAVGSLSLTFSEPVAGLDLGDLQLRRDGQIVELAGDILSGSGSTYVVFLENLTAVQGVYVLTLRSAGAGIVDAAGNALAADAVASFTVDTNAPWGTFAAVVPDPRATAVGSLGLSFSEAVSGLDLADLRLSRDGELVELAGNLLSGSGDSYTLDLANFTAPAGQYVLTLGASGTGLRDAAGNSLAGDVVVAWTTETTPPGAQFNPIVPDPRRTPVMSLGLTFTEAVTGVDLGDLELTRNGTPVSLAGNLLTGSGATYELDLAHFTAAEGDYVLTLAAGGSGIVDLAGNMLIADATVRWTTDLTAPTAQWAQVVPNPRNTPVGLLQLTFSEEVTGVDAGDFRLLRNGQEVVLAGVVVAGSGANYALDLASFTAVAGNYVLTLAANGSEIRDEAGNLLVANASVQWLTDVAAPTATFEAVAPNPRNTALGTIGLTFSEPVSGLDLAYFQLTRGGEVVALTGDILSGSGRTYSLDLTSLTGESGEYVLTLRAVGSAIRDAAGNAFASDAVAAWSTDTTRPTVQFAAVTPDPRNTAVNQLGISFSEPVTGFDLGDLQLRRGGEQVALAGYLLSGSGADFVLDLSAATSAAGSYTLTLVAGGSGILDSAGNALAAGASVSWTLDTTAPTAQFAAVSPDPRNTAVGSLALMFSESVSGFDLADLKLTRDGQLVPLAGNLLSGSGASYTLNLAGHTAASGNYVLTLGAAGSGIVDAAGNALSTGAGVSWTTDAAPPTAQFAAVTPSPRETPVGALALTFSEPVSGVDLADLQLTRNGALVPLAGNILSGSGATYALDLTNFTAAEGAYVLTLVAGGSGIRDSLGNPLAANASVGWTLKLNSHPPSPDSPADVNGDGVVNTTDLLAVVNWIVQHANRPGTEVPANLDINRDGAVDVLDLLAVVNEIVRRNNPAAGAAPANLPVASEARAATEGASEATGAAIDAAIAETYGPSSGKDEPLLALLAADTASEHLRRRRSK